MHVFNVRCSQALRVAPPQAVSRVGAARDTAIYLDTIHAAAIALIDEARFRIPGWKLAPQDIQVVENCINRLIQEGKVRDHRFDKPLPSLGLQSAVLISHKYILQAIRSPPKSMDTIVNQLHILSLLVGTGARAGDLGFVGKDVEAALKLREIELFLAPEKQCSAVSSCAFESHVIRAIESGMGCQSSTN